MGEETRDKIATACLATFGVLCLVSLTSAFAIVAYGFSPFLITLAELHPAFIDWIPTAWQERNIQPGMPAYGHAMIASVISTTFFVVTASTQVRAYSGQPFFARRRFVFFVGSTSLVIATHSAFGQGSPLRIVRDAQGMLLDSRMESSVATWVLVGLFACGAVLAFSRAQARHEHGYSRWSLSDFRAEGGRRPVHLQMRGPRARHHGGYLSVEETGSRNAGSWWSRGRDDDLVSPPQTGDLIGELIDTAPTLIEQAMDQRTVDMVRGGSSARAGALVPAAQLAEAPPIPWWVAFGRHAKRMTTPTRCDR